MIFSALIILILFLLLGSIILFFFAKGKKEELGIPQGKITYVDTKEEPGVTLYAKSVPLNGKPDYLVKQGNTIIPIEQKTGKTPSYPWKNHIAQLYCYCLLVEEQFGRRPSYGIIKYPEEQFKVLYNEDIKQHVQTLVTELLKNKQRGKERYSLLKDANLCRDCRTNDICRKRLL